MPKATFHSAIAWMIVLACLCQGCYNTPQQTPQQVTLPPTKLSAVDLQFGRQQVDQMMRDRGEMIACVQKNDIIYEWVTRQFAGEATGQRIYWSADPPPCASGCLGFSSPAYNSMSGTIQVREQYATGAEKGKNVPCEELWATTVFELYNISYGEEHVAGYNSALAGKLSRQDYILGAARTEYKAIRKTAEFYRNIWQPRAQQNQMRAEPSYWFADEPESYEEWIKQYNDPSDYPYSSYGHEYDSEIAPYVKR